MRFFAGDHRNRRRAEQSIGFDVPARLRQHDMPGRSERREVGDGRAGDETCARAGRQFKQLGQPAQRHLFEVRGARGHSVQGGILIPCAREPVRRQRDWQCAADDEAEEARPGHRHRRR